MLSARMTSLALTLLLIAAVLHATWNFWAKRAGCGEMLKSSKGGV